MKKEANRLHEKAIKFLIVGGIGTALNYATFTFLLKVLGIYYLVSSAIGYITGLVLGYYMNKNWTYYTAASNPTGEQKVFFYKYLVVYMASLAAQNLFLFFLVDRIQLDEMVSNLFAIGLSTVTNFLGTNFLVFKDDK